MRASADEKACSACAKAGKTTRLSNMESVSVHVIDVVGVPAATGHYNAPPTSTGSDYANAAHIAPIAMKSLGSLT
jgi:hypothetical protein